MLAIHSDVYVRVAFFHCKFKLDTLLSLFQPTEDKDKLCNGTFLQGFCMNGLQLILQQQPLPDHIEKEISDFSEL